jgi:thymidylate synthase (FAD)
MVFDNVLVKTPILDHGYVQLIESWGSDERIIEAARMSTNKGFQGWGRDPSWICPTCGYECAGSIVERLMERDQDTTRPVDREYTNAFGRREPQPRGCIRCPNYKCRDTQLIKTNHPPGDEKLLSYLYNHKHHTPFEMGGLIIEVQAPIFVFREWHRHRTQSYNELSARYTPLPDSNYTPTTDRCLIVNNTNKQAGTIAGAQTLTHESVLEWLSSLEHSYDVAQACYQDGLKRGIPKEVARLPVPVARYSRMRASANLRNWLAFLTLRQAPEAQWEIRQYANALGPFVERCFPQTWKLFVS